jgi:hypothetical protein
MKPNFQQLAELVQIARDLGYESWADRLEDQIIRLKVVFEQIQ